MRDDLRCGLPTLCHIFFRYMRPAKCSLAYCSHACVNVKMSPVQWYRGLSNLCGLANFCTDDLPLIRLVILDGVEESLTLIEHQSLMSDASAGLTYLIFCKFCIVHILQIVSRGTTESYSKQPYLIPMLLDTSFSSTGKGLAQQSQPWILIRL